MIENSYISVQQLYDYISRLHPLLRERGAAQLAESVEVAGKFSSGSPTEFFGECRIALDHVSNAPEWLTEHEFFSLKSIIRKIDQEFNRINMA